VTLSRTSVYMMQYSSYPTRGSTVAIYGDVQIRVSPGFLGFSLSLSKKLPIVFHSIQEGMSKN